MYVRARHDTAQGLGRGAPVYTYGTENGKLATHVHTYRQHTHVS